MTKMSMLPTRYRVGEGVVFVCPHRDRECDYNPGHTCKSCPRRVHVAEHDDAICRAQPRLSVIEGWLVMLNNWQWPSEFGWPELEPNWGNGRRKSLMDVIRKNLSQRSARPSAAACGTIVGGPTAWPTHHPNGPKIAGDAVGGTIVWDPSLIPRNSYVDFQAEINAWYSCNQKFLEAMNPDAAATLKKIIEIGYGKTTTFVIGGNGRVTGFAERSDLSVVKGG